MAETNAKLFPMGTLLMAMYGEGKTRGKVSELRIEATTNQACAAIVFRSVSSTCQPYIKRFLQSKYLEIRQISSGGVQPNLNLQKIKDTIIPLPSLAEQVQIIALVEERLSIIAELEATIEKALKRAERQRQSILRKAFTGRLVPQNPEDEPASMLLERIRQEREQAWQSERPVVRTPTTSRGRRQRPTRDQQTSWLLEQTVEPIETSSVAQQSLWAEKSEVDVSALTNDAEKQHTSDDSEQDIWQQAIIRASQQK